MAKKQDPPIDWGFHAVIPRIIRTGYEKLSPVQKWLYVCLKDLCGEHGTCYRSLRVLAEETGISTGMLSESIRVIHDAGLVHAEKKRRSTNPTAKEVWHITIIDIWQANAKEHPTKRSQNEHYQENVHTVNNNVHTVNDISSERSQNEQKRSHSETEEESLSSINTEAVSIEEEGVGSSEPTAPALFIHPEHSFLAFDSLEHPTLMVISFVDDDRAEITNKTRARIAETQAHILETKGCSVQVRKEYESVDTRTIDAPANITHLEEKRQRRGDTDKHKAVKIGENHATPDTLPADIPDSPGSSTGNDTASQEQEESQSPPGASSQRAAPEKAAGQSELETPKMALTARQIKAQNEKREKELWAIIEAERNTKYSATQRKLYENAEGMKCLIADDISDETIRDGLQALDAFQRKSFTILKFYGWLPNLNAKTPTPITSKAPSQNGYDKHELNMRKLEERKARLAAHG